MKSENMVKPTSEAINVMGNIPADNCTEPEKGVYPVFEGEGDLGDEQC